MPEFAALEVVLSALPGGYLLLDNQQQVKFVSQRFELLLQLPPLGKGTLLPLHLLPAEVGKRLGPPVQPWSMQHFHHGVLLDWLITPLPNGVLLSVREDRQAFRTLVENSPDIISRYDTDLLCLYANSALGRYSRLPPAMHVGLSIDERGLPASMCDAMRHAARQVLTSGQPYSFETEISRPDMHRVFESRLLPELDENGQIQSLICIDRDISEQHASRLWQADENRLLEMIANDRPLPEVMVWTCHMIEGQLAGSTCSIMLLDDSGQHLHVAAGPGLPDEYKQQIDGIAIGEGVGSCGTAASRGEAVIVTDMQSDPLWAPYLDLVAPFGLRACWSLPIIAHNGQVLGTFAIYFHSPTSPDNHALDICQRTSHLMAIAIQQEQRANQLFQLATQDSLTGLINRRHFMELAGQSFRDSWHSGKPLSILMFDLDHFKSVNDRYGHEAGDDVLRSFAQTLQDSLRSTDLICRMGGEEFAALLVGTPQEEALAAAQRVCKVVEETAVTSREHLIHLTVSIGLCTLESSVGSLGKMIRLADKALYQAKNEGRNRVCIADADL